MPRAFLFLCMVCAQRSMGQGDSVAVQFTAHPDTVHNAITLAATVGQIGATVVNQDDAAPITALSWSGALTLKASQPKWHFDARYEWMRDTGTRFDRWTEAGFDRRHGEGQMATRLRGRWNWHPLPSVKVEVGRDTLHDGHGRRSLFRGGQAAPVPFVQVSLDGGRRLRYRHRMEALQGHAHIDCRTGATGDPRTWVPPTGPLRTGIQRMLVSHRLELDLGGRFTGALWGAVVWNAAAGQRVFEPHYLLPMTSLRPTEYMQGSSDNALVGLEGLLRLGQGGPDCPRHLYGQFLLDELIVSELLGGTEWWGNKHGLLGGLLWTTRWGGWRIEGSAVRPWTYSHYTPTSAYLTGLTPLAHPLGANFVEGTFSGHWSNGTWTVTALVTHSLRGDDLRGDTPSGSLPQVGDIDRTEETYAWLNGTARKRWLGAMDIGRAWPVAEEMTLTAFAQLAHGRETAPVTPAPTQEWWLSFGLRSTGPFFGADW